VSIEPRHCSGQTFALAHTEQHFEHRAQSRPVGRVDDDRVLAVDVDEPPDVTATVQSDYRCCAKCITIAFAPELISSIKSELLG